MQIRKSENTFTQYVSLPPPKILFIAKVYSHLAAFHIPFMKLLQEKGYEVHAAASSDQGRTDEVKEAGVICHEIPFSRSLVSFSNLRAYSALRKLLKKQSFTLIHVHTPIAAFMGRFIARSCNQGKVLYTAHGFHFFKGAPLLNWLIYYNAERIASRWTDGLIVMNNEDYANAIKLGFTPDVDLYFVNGVGVDIEHYSTTLPSENRIRGELGLSSCDVIVSCVAEFDENKNHDFLLHAWAETICKNDNCHLLLIGAGEKQNIIRKEIEQKSIKKVHILGYRNDVEHILKDTDILVLVSKREGLPKSIMEAMAAGKPVIASDTRGNRDLVRNSVTGLLVDIKDSKTLINALTTLIKDSKLRDSMGKKGFLKIQEYSIEKVSSHMASIYARYLPKDNFEKFPPLCDKIDETNRRTI